MQFLGQWSRLNLAQEIAYNVEKTGQLMVVTEDENSAKTTYWYKLGLGHEVWVVEDVVHTTCHLHQERAWRPDQMSRLEHVPPAR